MLRGMHRIERWWLGSARDQVIKFLLHGSRSNSLKYFNIFSTYIQIVINILNFVINTTFLLIILIKLLCFIGLIDIISVIKLK